MSAPATPPPGRKRKSRSLRVERDACLWALGVDPTLPWHMQHDPPLGIRPWNEKAHDYDPPENDFRHMKPMQVKEHKKVTKEVDRPAIDKTRRVAKKQAKHTEKMDYPTLMMHPDITTHYMNTGGKMPSKNWLKHWRPGIYLPPWPKRKWPKGRKIQSRGFQPAFKGAKKQRRVPS